MSGVQALYFSSKDHLQLIVELNVCFLSNLSCLQCEEGPSNQSAMYSVADLSVKDSEHVRDSRTSQSRSSPVPSAVNEVVSLTVCVCHRESSTLVLCV